VVDNFSTGHRDAIPNEVTAIETADIRDKPKMNDIFSKYAPVTAIYHFCASIIVSESMSDPLNYYSNNVLGTLTVLVLV
jgi:UDP-glucose 4-epimerase